METTQTSTIASKDSRSAWRKTDTMWMLGLYGTAIGAGVLFLPINAGVGGMIPLIIMAILAFPMTFFAHRGLTRFVLSGKNPGEDITEVVEEHFGIGAGKLITLLYFFAIYPILLVYSVAITNTVESFMSHQLGMTPPPRAILSLILIVGMMTIVRFGEQMIVKAMSILVFPFVGNLLFRSFGGDCNGLLWPDCFSGTGCSASLPCFVPYFRPSDIDAFFFTGRGGNGVIV